MKSRVSELLTSLQSLALFFENKDSAQELSFKASIALSCNPFFPFPEAKMTKVT